MDGETDQPLGIEDAWNAVTLEERLDLVTSSQASGIVAAFASMALIGSVAYGFDQIWILLGSLASWVLIMPLFSSLHWRVRRPNIILTYLAVRAVARRYAYGHQIPNINIILIFRGTMEELFRNQEELEMYKQSQSIELGKDSSNRKRNVWICLMRGGLVVMSERLGGAKLEFLTPIVPESKLSRPSEEEGDPETQFVIDGAGPSKGRRILLASEQVGALYVFEKQYTRLNEEAVGTAMKLENLRKSMD